jgi:hypothetical protein
VQTIEWLNAEIDRLERSEAELELFLRNRAHGLSALELWQHADRLIDNAKKPVEKLRRIAMGADLRDDETLSAAKMRQEAYRKANLLEAEARELRASVGPIALAEVVCALRHALRADHKLECVCVKCEGARTVLATALGE